MADAALVLDVQVARGNFRLDVQLDVPPGVTILFGPSGAGKSTTLLAIAGLVTPASGRVALASDVWFDGAARINRPVEQRHLAFVFQSLALFPHLKALANVEYGLPRLVLLDEPFSALDRALRRDFVADLRAWVAEARVPVIHVTHQRDEARALGDRLARLQDGRIRAIGPVDDFAPDDE